MIMGWIRETTSHGGNIALSAGMGNSNDAYVVIVEIDCWLFCILHTISSVFKFMCLRRIILELSQK